MTIGHFSAGVVSCVIYLLFDVIVMEFKLLMHFLIWNDNIVDGYWTLFAVLSLFVLWVLRGGWSSLAIKLNFMFCSCQYVRNVFMGITSHHMKLKSPFLLFVDYVPSVLLVTSCFCFIRISAESRRFKFMDDCWFCFVWSICEISVLRCFGSY